MVLRRLNLLKLRKLHLINKRLYAISKEQYNSNLSSYLYINSDAHVTRKASPYLPLNEILKNIESYSENLRRRKVYIDLGNIKDKIEELNPILEKYEKLKNAFRNENRDENQPTNELSDNEYIETKSIKEKMEDNLIPLLLQLPNWLSKDTPNEDEIEILTSPIRLQSKSHIEIGQLTKGLIYKDSKCYYLMDKCAQLEQSIVNWLLKYYYKHSYLPVSCPDSVYTYIMEGAGTNFNDPDASILMKHEEGNENNKLYLVGSSSLEAFCSYFTRHVILTRSFPIKNVVWGRTYNPSCRYASKNSLYNVVQANCVRSSVVALDESNAEIHYDEMVEILKSCYSKIGLPHRIVKVSDVNLHFTESARTQIEIFSPHEDRYIPCANVSNYRDFISRRLCIRHGRKDRIRGFCHLVSGVSGNVPVLMAAIMENLQQENGDFAVPDVFRESVEPITKEQRVLC